MTQSTLFGECIHAHTIVVPEHRGPHYAKKLCAECHKFLGWLPKPETIKQREENERILTELSKIDQLTGWEREFIRSLVTHKHISPKQQGTLLDLHAKYFAKESTA